MDVDLLRRMVRVEAVFTGRDEPKRGSGFRLAKGRILTCRHVIEDLETKRPLESIHVSRDPDGSGTILRAEAECLWKGGGDGPTDRDSFRALDAAVLADGFEDDPGPFERLVRLPQDDGRWSGAGFASHSTSTQKLHHPDGFAGRFDPVLDLEMCLSLKVDDKAPSPAGKDKGDWGGVSGGPVFIDGGPLEGHLYGLLRQKPESYDDRLYAVLIPALLRDPGFCQAISWTEAPPPHGSLVIACRRFLKDQPELARHLKSLDKNWQAGWQSAGCEGLLDSMCRTGDVETLLKGLEVLAKAVKNSPASLEALRESSVFLVGLLAHHELHRRGVERVSDGQKAQINVASPNFAEAVQAASEGRPALYKKQEGDLPGRVLEVPAVGMEAGIQREHLAKDHLEEIAARFVEHHFDEAPYLWDAQRRILKGADDAERLKVLVHAVNRNLQRFAEEKGGKPYFLITPETRSHDLENHLDDFLKYLAALLPSAVLLEISGDAQDALDREFALEPLWKILDLM